MSGMDTSKDFNLSTSDSGIVTEIFDQSIVS